MSAASLDRSALIEKAAALVQRGELNAALPQYVRLFHDDPTDWNVANTLGDLYVRAGKSGDAVAHFSSVAEQLAADGFIAKARALYRKILRIQPTSAIAKQRVDELDKHGVSASPFLQRVLETARVARETPEAEAGDPVPDDPPVPPVPPVAPAPLPPAAQAVSPEPNPVPLPPRDPQPVDEFADVEAAVDAAATRQDFAAATAEIEQFLVTHPRHTRALEKFIEVGVDCGRTADLPWAQLRLAEACLEVGRFQQAQDIAIDLIFREPGSTRHQELLDRVTAAARERRQWLRPVSPPEPDTADKPVEAAPPPVVHSGTRDRDLAPPTPPSMATRPLEEPAAASVEAAQPSAEPGGGDDLPADLQEWSDAAEAFDDIRTTLIEEAAAAAEERFAEADRLISDGHPDQATRALEEAMCAPHLRTPAGARLAAIYRDIGAPIEALACLEWVAEMPPPNEESAHELAYQLALTLEALGQQAQALGVYRELLAEVGPTYRDIATRTERLTAA